MGGLRRLSRDNPYMDGMLRTAVRAAIGLAGVLVALHFVGGENDRLRAEVRRTSIELKHARLDSAECGQLEAPGLLVQVSE